MTRRRVFARLLFGPFLIALLYAPPVRAQTTAPAIPSATASTPVPPPIPVSADQVNAIAHNLYCPVCENTPLDVCPTDACIRWRAQIRDLLGQGQNEEQVDQYFIDHFGMRTVGIPTDPTSRLLTVGIPFALIVVAGLLIFWQLWRWYHSRGLLTPAVELKSPPGEPDHEADEYRARIEAELRDKR
ncbi:MAG: cytochrome c-type biogenesis protein [Aggregatilineales bacterium]